MNLKKNTTASTSSTGLGFPLQCFCWTSPALTNHDLSLPVSELAVSSCTPHVCPWSWLQAFCSVARLVSGDRCREHARSSPGSSRQPLGFPKGRNEVETVRVTNEIIPLSYPSALPLISFLNSTYILQNSKHMQSNIFQTNYNKKKHQLYQCAGLV